MTEELSSVRVERANLRADLDEMTTIVQRMKENVRKPLSTVSREVQKTYDDMVDAVSRKIQEDLVDRCKSMETHFQDDSARLAVSAGEELLQRSSDVQRSLGKSPALFSSRVTKPLDVGSSSKSPSASVKKTKKPRKAACSKGPKNLLKVLRAVTRISLSTQFKRRYCR